MKWPPKNEVFKKARVDRGVYLCTTCQQNVPASVKVGNKRLKNVYVDHRLPIVDPEIGFTSWDEFINALYCDSTNLQVMCLECHSKKTAEERRISTERARKQKENEKLMTNFDEIEYLPLRAWNRCVMMFNIAEDQGLQPAAEYLKQFSDKEKTEMLDMYNKVKQHGPEEVKRQIILAMPLQEDEVAE